jgi:nucleotide-binding universal stress UspA family protein
MSTTGSVTYPVAARHGQDNESAPIVAAVDGSAASRAAIGEAVRLGADLKAPIVFVYVRRGPARFFGAPFYQRRLTTEMTRARRVLGRALALADHAGLRAEGRDTRRIPATTDPCVRA